ncbi:MAG: MFS transporter [Nitrososphaerota archaeon]
MGLIRLTSGLPRDFWILLSSLFLINMFALGFSPFMAYFLREIGASVSETAFVLALSRVGYGLLLLVGGVVGDFVGRRLPLIIGPIVIGFSFIALSGARTWSDAIIPLTFSMLPTAFTAPAVFAYISDIIDEPRYGRAYGIYFAIMNLSAILGYVIVGHIIEIYGYVVSLESVGAVSILTALVRVWLREPRRSTTLPPLARYLREAYGTLKDRLVSLLVLSHALYIGMATTMVSVIIPSWARDIASMGEAQLSIIFAIESAVYSVLSPIGGRLIESSVWWLRLSILELLIKIPALLLLTQTLTFFQLLLVMILDSGLAIFVLPVLDSRLSAALASIHRGAIWGLQQSITQAATISLTLIGGYAWGALGPVNTVLAFLAYPVGMTLLILFLARASRGSHFSG